MNRGKAFFVTTFFVAIFIGTFAQTPDADYFYGKFRKGSKAYVFGDNVNLRTEPSINSSSVAKLKIGTEVLIVEERESYTLSGITAPWYLVETGKNSGWIWGGLLALTGSKIEQDLLMYGLVAFQPDSDFVGEARLIRSGKVISGIRTRAFWTRAWMSGSEYIYSVGNEVLSSKSLQNVSNVWAVHFEYGACGHEFGGQYFALSGNQLLFIAETPCVNEAGLFHFETVLIFPADSGGKPDMVIIRATNSEYDEKISQYVLKESEDTELFWDGKSFR